MEGEGAPGGAPDPSARASAVVAGGILLSRLTGLVRESLLRGVLGLGPAADAFAAALRIPNLLQNLLGEGSLSAAFIPVYSRMLGEGRQEEAGRVAGAVAGLLTALAGGLVTVGILAARPLARLLAPGFEGARMELTVDLIRVTTAGVGLLVLAAWCLGVLNSHRRFFLSYVAPVLWNVAQVAVLAAAILGNWEPANTARSLAWGLVVGGLLQFGIQAIGVRRLRTGIRPSAAWRLPGVVEVIRRSGPAVLGRGVLQLSAYLDLVLASLLVTGAVAGLMSAQVLYVLPVSLFALSVAAAELPEMSRHPDGAGVAQRGGTAMRRTSFFLVFSSVAYLALGDLIVGALFGWGAFDGDDAIAVWLVLGAYALGLPALGASRICQSVLYSRGDTTGPARIAALRMAVAGGIGLAVMFPLDRLSIVDGSLVGWADLFQGWGPLEGAGDQATAAPHLGAVGLAIGSAGAAWLESALLSHRGRRTLQDLPMPVTVLVPLFPAALAAALVAVAARPLVGGLPDLMAAPLGLVVAGSAYLLVAWRTGIEEAASAAGILRRLVGR